MSRKALWCFFVLAAFSLLDPAVARAEDDDSECHTEAPTKLILFTGKHGFNYNIVGRAIAEAYNEQAPPPDKLIVACSSDGSLENVQKLSAHKATFALVQSDVAHAVWFSHPLLMGDDRCNPIPTPLQDDSEQLQLITPLYTEVLHVLVRPHLNVSSLADLKQRRAWTGRRQSGTFFTAERVLSAAGVRMCDIPEAERYADDLNTSAGDALTQIRTMGLDAVFYTGAVPTHVVQDAVERSPEIRLLPLEYDLVKRLTSDGSYVEILIRHTDYGQDFGNQRGTLTVGVQALLVTNNDFPAETKKLVDYLANAKNRQIVQSRVAKLLEEQKAQDHEDEFNNLQEHPKEFKREVLLWYDLSKDQQKLKEQILELDPKSKNSVVLDPYQKSLVFDYWRTHEDEVPPINIMGLTTPAPFRDHLQSDARKAFQNLWWKSWILDVLVLGVVFLVLFVLFCRNRKKLGPILVKSPGVTFAAIGIVLAWITGAAIMVHLEGDVNEDFSLFRTALLNIPSYFMPVRGDTALTPNGQLTLRILWWVVVALGAGSLLPYIQSRLNVWVWQPLSGWLEGNPWTVRDRTKPIVIINWDRRVMERITQQREVDHAPDRPAVIVAPSVPGPTLNTGSQSIRLVQGEGTDEDCLEKACVRKAFSVTIFSSWQPSNPGDRRKVLDADSADTKTILAILQIRQLSRHRPNGWKVPITAEILSPRNRDEAERAGRGGKINVLSL
jgi:TRAP transporter TAXI family solute receptor